MRAWHTGAQPMAAHKTEKEPASDGSSAQPRPLTPKEYEKELRRLQIELLRLEEWVRHQGLRVVVIFEGRDTAGKGGMIKRITAMLNPRFCRVVALPAPTERERSQWYFQRYVAHLPSAGEIVLFDRSWYNRAGVEHVMGFCNEDEYEEFMRTCPLFERMLIRSGIILIKYWLSVSDEEQERRFQARINDPRKRWKLSPMDLQARARWVDYSEAKDQMFAYTDIKESPWYVVETDNKKSAHLNLITHLLSLIEYDSVPHEHIEVPTRQKRAYERPPKALQTMVPTRYEVE
jgi:polyphosphate kinase 2